MRAEVLQRMFMRAKTKTEQCISTSPPEIPGAECLKNTSERYVHHLNRVTELIHTHGGLGLGLYLTKYYLDAMHGSLDVKSKLGEGGYFSVRIPLRKSCQKRRDIKQRI